MRRGFRSIVLCTIFALAGQVPEAAARGLDRNPSANVAFDLYFDYLIVVQTTAGPLKGLHFLLDTGATPSVIDPHIASRLHLNTSPIQIAVLNGTSAAATATLPSLRIGPIQKENFPVLIEDLAFLAKTLPVQVDGILGLDVLGQSPFLIDYASRRILFGAAPALSTSVPIQLKQGLPMVSATVNQQPVQLLLDTGAPSLILFQAPAVLTASDQLVSSKSIGDYDHKKVRLRSFALGHTTFTDEPAFLVPSRKDSGHNFDGLMSPAALGITRVSVDLPNGELGFSRER